MQLEQCLKAEIGLDNYLVKVHSEINDWISDEPLQTGGKGKGPSPHELLLSSLASCMLITVRMYVERKGWNLEKAEVFLNLNIEVVDDVKHSHISTEIHFHGELDQEQKQRLRHIAQICPISRLLEGNVKIHV